MIPFARPEQQITHQAPVAAVRFAIPDQQSTQQAPVATIPFAPRITQSTHSVSSSEELIPIEHGPYGMRSYRCRSVLEEWD
jgi:hypothetical protein